jgi:hypothetical protein
MMTPDSAAYQKLRRLETLMNLKTQLAEEKQHLQSLIVDRTTPLLEAAQACEIEINFDDQLGALLTTFDEQIHRIEHELLTIAA